MMRANPPLPTLSVSVGELPRLRKGLTHGEARNHRRQARSAKALSGLARLLESGITRPLASVAIAQLGWLSISECACQRICRQVRKNSRRKVRNRVGERYCRNRSGSESSWNQAG